LHDFSTRAGHDRHHRRAARAAAVVAVLLFVAAITLFAPAIASSAQPDSVEISGVPQAAEELFAEAMAEHDVAIEIVSPGREGLELTARLTDNGGLIERAISWTIMTPDGDTVYSGEAPEAAIATPPGDYAVSIRYGAVRLNSMVTLLEGNRLMVSYVLHAGAIRILPRVQNIVAPGAAPDSRIYALEGRQRGRLVAISTVPGEVVRVPEGLYRVESAFDGGNARASTEVRVKAGRMSAVEIDHKAGVARLSYVGAPDAPVLWQLVDAKGQAVLAAEGLSAQAVLLPGTYTASARINGETLTATFAIAAGETRDIILGN
jgi:hypothetical protein